MVIIRSVVSKILIFMKNKKDIVFLIVVCLLFLIIAGVYNFKTESFGGPDEFGHFEYVRYLSENHHFPAYKDKITFWEAHQPPLYYMSLAPVDMILKNRVSIDWQVRILRICSSLMGVLAIIFCFFGARLVFPKSRVLTYSAVLAFTFWPMFLFINGILNNDVLACLLGTVMLYFLIRLFLKGLSRFGLLICGVVVVLALLTKLVLYPVVIFFLAVLLIRNFKKWKDVLLCSFLPALILGGAWMIRNLIVVGDVFGLKYANKFWKFQGQELWGNFYDWLKALSKNFLGVFGQADIGLDPQNYIYFMTFVLFVICLSPIVLFFIWRRVRDKFGAILICYLYFGVVFLSVLYYSLDKYQPQGRYLLPGLFSVALIIVLSISILIPHKFRIVIPILICLSLGYLNYDAFVHIDWKNDHREIVNQEEEFDMLNKGWKARNGKWKEQDGVFVFSAEGDSFLRSNPNLRLDTNEIESLNINLRTEDYDEVKLQWRYVGDEDYSESNMIMKKMDKNLKFDLSDLRKNDLVQILKLDFGGGEGGVEFGKLNLSN